MIELLKMDKFYEYKKYAYVPNTHLFEKCPLSRHNRKQLLIHQEKVI